MAAVQAATVTSSTAHGIPLTGAGLATVLLCNQPAWRITDQHTCSVPNTPPPAGPGGTHAVGMITTPGAATVFAGGQVLAHVGDVITEAAAFPPVPNNILVGAATVMVP